MWMLLNGIFLILLATVKGSVNEFDAAYGVYRDNTEQELMQDLYKRLASIDTEEAKRARDADTDYGENVFFPADYKGDEFYAEHEGDNADDDGSQMERSYGAERFIGDKSTMIRDPELTQHSSNLGILQMTELEEHQSKAGPIAVENLKGIKSDDPLPFYCHPPNPCPKGYTSRENNCQEFIEDTADYQKEWIHEMQRKGICTCDEEHMFDCSSSSSSSSSSSPSSSSSSSASSASSSSSEEDRNMDIGSKHDMDEFFNSFVKEKEQENPFTQRGHKRISLVAKKSPRSKRDTRQWQMDLEMSKIAKQSSDNPYMSGKKLPTVAKKGVDKRRT